MSTATRGASVVTSSSWNEDSSQTIQASGDDVPDEGGQGATDVPGHLDRHAPRLQDRAEQRGRRRLPVRAGDGDERVRKQPGAELDLGDDRDAASAGGDDRLGLGRHPGALHEQPDPVEHRVVPGAEPQLGLEAGDVHVRIGVVRDDLDPVPAKREHRGPAGAEETDDEHA